MPPNTFAAASNAPLALTGFGKQVSLPTHKMMMPAMLQVLKAEVRPGSAPPEVDDDTPRNELDTSLELSMFSPLKRDQVASTQLAFVKMPQGSPLAAEWKQQVKSTMEVEAQRKEQERREREQQAINDIERKLKEKALRKQTDKTEREREEQILLAAVRRDENALAAKLATGRASDDSDVTSYVDTAAVATVPGSPLHLTTAAAEAAKTSPVPQVTVSAPDRLEEPAADHTASPQHKSQLPISRFRSYSASVNRGRPASSKGSSPLSSSPKAAIASPPAAAASPGTPHAREAPQGDVKARTDSYKASMDSVTPVPADISRVGKTPSKSDAKAAKEESKKLSPSKFSFIPSFKDAKSRQPVQPVTTTPAKRPSEERVTPKKSSKDNVLKGARNETPQHAKVATPAAKDAQGQADTEKREGRSFLSVIKNKLRSVSPSRAQPAAAQDTTGASTHVPAPMTPAVVSEAVITSKPVPLSATVSEPAKVDTSSSNGATSRFIEDLTRARANSVTSNYLTRAHTITHPPTFRPPQHTQSDEVRGKDGVSLRGHSGIPSRLGASHVEAQPGTLKQLGRRSSKDTVPLDSHPNVSIC